MTSVNLSTFEVDPIRGFLPTSDPLDRLPATFTAWEDLVARLPALMAVGRAREEVSRLAPIVAETLLDDRQRWRAYLLLSLIANAYVMDGAHAKEPLTVPRVVAVPLCQVAGALRMPPVLTYSALVLHNWARIDPDGPIDVDNLVPLCSVVGGVDEQWFFLSMTAIEAKGGPALSALVEARNGVAADSPSAVTTELIRAAHAQSDMVAALQRLPQRCDPYIFFNRIRPAINNWPESGVVYDGVDTRPRSWIGASGAQSSLTQALDIALGVRHPPAMERFLRLLRDYMPTRHRQFLNALATGPSIRDYVLASTGRGHRLRQAYNEAIDLLDTFRRKHMEIVVRYISKQTDGDGIMYGTSGTDFVRFLHQMRRDTATCRVSSCGSSTTQGVSTTCRTLGFKEHGQ